MAVNDTELTPMQQQYRALKEKNKDSILFFRLGDFYEMFNEDAILAARELDLTLTTRDRTKPKEEQTPMCGVPYHSVDAYIARMVQKGYKVAVCEQMQDPKEVKGLVERPGLLRCFHRRILCHHLPRCPHGCIGAGAIFPQRGAALR